MKKKKWVVDFTAKAQWQFGLWLIPNSFWFGVHLFSLRLIIRRGMPEIISPIVLSGVSQETREKEMINKLKKYWFTFGSGQPHEGCYHVIKAKSYGEARNVMFERFGAKWARQYNSAEEAGVEKFNLCEIK